MLSCSLETFKNYEGQIFISKGFTKKPYKTNVLFYVALENKNTLAHEHRPICSQKSLPIIVRTSGNLFVELLDPG